MIGEGYPIDQPTYLPEQEMLFFTFLSEGHRIVEKLVIFNPVVSKGVKYYNWGFGDIYKNENGTLLNDVSPTNNGDTKKVFYTVASTLVVFFQYYPNGIVRIKGSDDRRTKLYTSLIARHRKDIEKLYELKMSRNNITFEFNRNEQCDYILISRLPNTKFE